MAGDDWRSASLTEEGRYRLLVEAVTDYAICMLDPGGIVTSWSPGAQHLKGCEAPEIIGRHFSCFYTDEDRQAGEPARALDTALRKNKFEGEGWRIRQDGTRFWAHVVIDPIRTPAGDLAGFAQITRNLSAHKVAEEALRRSEEQFTLLVQSVTDYSIYMLDLNGRVSSWNTGAQRIKGYSPEEIIGAHFSRFYTQDDRQNGEPAKALETAAREGRFEREAIRVRKDGSHFYAHVVIDAIRDAQGVLIGYAKITRDVTERVEAQRALEQAREALFQSQKMDAIGQLTGGIAHDFNNLLTAVLGSLELVRKRLPDDPKIKTLIDNAMQGALRGTALTQRMLAFARRQDLKPEPVDVPTLVQGMTDLLQTSLGPSIPIETRYPLTLPAVHADANQLELALLNLAVNGRDAMPGGGRLVISARQENVGPNHGTGLNPGSYVCLSVADTGEGMDEAVLARATEPFFTTKGVGKGTGLGLPMVHGVAEQSGGRLILKSRKGVGTTAELWLPMASEGAGADRLHQLSGQKSKSADRQLIIVAVDDDSLVLVNTVAMLEELGHLVFPAGSGNEALAIIRREEKVDLVITDQAMPQMTGSQLLEAIRTDWPDLPVILATGYAELSSDVTEDLLRLAKPFNQRDLAQAVAGALHAEATTGRIVRFPAR